MWYKFKQKFGRFAIQNLSLYVTLIFAIGYLVMIFNSNLYNYWLGFYPVAVLKGEIWRIFTVLFYPPSVSNNLLLGALMIFIYYSFAQTVERSMGEFEYNVYFFGSILIGEIGSILYYLITKDYTAQYIPMFTHFAVFMAFAIMYSEQRVLLFFIIPIKVKWIAIVEVALYVYYLTMGLVFRNLETVIDIVCAFIPVVIFYLVVFKQRNGSGIISNWRLQREQKKRRKEWQDQWK
ncbi:MAG: hypothetical protein Q4B67_02170 [Eubacteriales bacterium]|nr:hypothetical protein [Eubacteriales bacterium]